MHGWARPTSAGARCWPWLPPCLACPLQGLGGCQRHREAPHAQPSPAPDSAVQACPLRWSRLVRAVPAHSRWFVDAVLLFQPDKGIRAIRSPVPWRRRADSASPGSASSPLRCSPSPGSSGRCGSPQPSPESGHQGCHAAGRDSGQWCAGGWQCGPPDVGEKPHTRKTCQRTHVLKGGLRSAGNSGARAS